MKQQKPHNDIDVTNTPRRDDQQPSKKPRTTSPKREISKASVPKRKPKSAQKNRKKIASTALSLRPSLQEYEMVWAHIKGFRNWPGIIEDETPKGKYKIHFFGDYTTSEVSKNKIMHLLEGFKDYASIDNPTTTLYKAITEAQMFILEQNRTE